MDIMYKQCSKSSNYDGYGSDDSSVVSVILIGKTITGRSVELNLICHSTGGIQDYLIGVQIWFD